LFVGYEEYLNGNSPEAGDATKIRDEIKDWVIGKTKGISMVEGCSILDLNDDLRRLQENILQSD
jgi:hypothetical protein